MQQLLKRIDQRFVLPGLVLLFGGIYTIQVVLNHYYLRTYALDYGFYNQAFWDFAHFRPNFNTVMEPQVSFFHIHPAFTLIILSPLYWIFNPIFGTYSLLIIQNIFIIAGGYAVYLLIKRKTGNFTISVLAFIHYNIIWGHFSALASDYIDTTVASSMVPIFILLIDKRKFIWAVVIFLFIITCKENMPLWMMFISFLLFIIYKEKKTRYIAISLGLFSLIYFIFLFQYLIPYYEDPDISYWGFAYNSLGDNPGEAIKYILSNPVDSMKLLFINHTGDPAFDNVKKEFYKVFLFSGGILLFRRPVYIIMFIPLIAQKMYNDSFIRWGILGFYSIEIVSVLTIAIFLSTISIKNLIFKYVLFGLLCLSTLLTTIHKLNNRITPYYDPEKENLISSLFYTSKLPVEKIRKQIDLIIPDTAAIAATQGIVPHYAQRKRVSIFPYIHDAEYIILIKGINAYPLSQAKFREELQKYLEDDEWKVILDDEPLLILKRRNPVMASNMDY